MSRGQGFTNPWKNPLGELLCSVYMRLVRAEPQVERIVEPPERPVPLIRTPVLRFCKECGEGTAHNWFYWVEEDIETEECIICETVKWLG